MRYIDIKDVKVSSKYLLSLPSQAKLDKKKKLIQTGNELSITVSLNNYILDGYIALLAYEELGITQIPCIVDEDVTIDGEDFTISQSLKLQIYEEAGGKCYICGRKDYRGNMTIDHFVPKSKGGTDVKSNLRCCCKVCNKLKATFTWSPELVKVIKRELKERHLL